MENKLKRVFDYQKFSSSRRLSAMITETENRYKALNEEDLFLVNAAGDTDIMNNFSENKDAYRDRNI